MSLILRLGWLFILFGCTAFAQDYQPRVREAAPTAYVFGFHPHLNPEELFEAYAPVLAYLQKRLPGTRFRFEGARDYAEFEARLKARRYHFALPNPLQAVLAQHYGYRVIAKNAPDEDFRGQLITRASRMPFPLHALEGQTVCFPSPTALAATLLPLMYLFDRGVDVKRLQLRYVGTQNSAILNAASGDAAACGVSARFLRAWQKDHPEQAKQIRVLFTTAPFPHNAVVARNDVPEALARQVAAALIALADDPAALATLTRRFGQERFEAANDATYAPARRFLERYDRAIGLPAGIGLPRAER